MEWHNKDSIKYKELLDFNIQFGVHVWAWDYKSVFYLQFFKAKVYICVKDTYDYNFGQIHN